MVWRLIKNDIHWLIFYFIVSVSWIFVFLTSKSVSDFTQFDLLYRVEFWRELCSQANGFKDLLSLFLMWVIMSGAMMMPTLVPTLRTYVDLRYTGSSNSIDFLLITLGFLLVWVAYSIFIAILQAFLIEQSVVDLNGKFISPLISAMVLASAGFYQFSEFKNSCASKCRAPLTFFMEFWAPGRVESFKMGLRLGLSCLGCCWMLMLLAFVGGTMNLAFMGLATLIMVLEKLPKLGEYISKPLGYMIILAACLNIAV